VAADERGDLTEARFGLAFAAALFGTATFLMEGARAALLAGSA
jgi:hypothetical protein